MYDRCWPDGKTEILDEMEESREQRGLGHCRQFDVEAVKQH